MKKILEDYLWNEINYVNDERWNGEFYRTPRDVIKEMIERKWIESPKQAYATLNKWTGKGIYEYGSCLDLGWKCNRRNIGEQKA